MYAPEPSKLIAAALLGAACSWLSSPAHAATDAEVVASLAEFNRHAHFKIPVLSAKERSRLLAGDVVKVIDEAPDGSGSRRAVGFILTDASRDAMWASCQDIHFIQNSSVHELRLSLSPPDKALWYGLIDLPRPFSDRHWVVDVWNNHSLAAATEDRAWEHPWSLHAGGVAKAKAKVEAGKVPNTTLKMWEDAIETPTNLGAWVAIELPDGGSLFVYHAATRVAGNVPEGLMLQFVRSTLDATLKSIEARAKTKVPSHYKAGHSHTVIGGDGQPLAPWPRGGG